MDRSFSTTDFALSVLDIIFIIIIFVNARLLLSKSNILLHKNGDETMLQTPLVRDDDEFAI